MTTTEVAQILAAVARVEEQVTGLRRDGDTATKRLDQHSTRLDKVERFAYVALGVALASGLPDLVALIA